MRVNVELFPQRRARAIDLEEGATGFRLLEALGLPPDVHILARADIPIPIDEELREGDRIRVIAVVSGG